MNPYISDILAQPDALRKAIRNFSAQSLDRIRHRLNNGEFDRIIVTGMGSSYNASYPACLQLATLPVPVLFANTAELLHFSSGQIGSRSLLWLNSQSGRSAEVVHLLERIKTSPPACILASLNDESSPLASAADVCLAIHAGPEATVSTKTYLNTLATDLLAALHLTGQDVSTIESQILAAADEIEAYLIDWQAHLSHIDTLLESFDVLFILGRGPSMSAAWTGALISKEAAKYAVEGMNAADFRHGPLELASSSFVALILSGSAETSVLNRNLATDIVKFGGRAIWLDTTPDGEFPTILHPVSTNLTRSLGEILPLQLLTLVLAKRKDVQAGHFRVIGKVTTTE